MSNFFGLPKSENNNEPNKGSAGSLMQSPLLNIDPKYLGGSDDYIFLEDAGPVRSRFQTMCSMVGVTTCVGGLTGGLQSLRYTGIQLLKGQKSKRMQMTSALFKNGGQVAQKFGAASFLYCACAIICEKSRGVDDEINTIVGGATAGALYSLPGVFNVHKYGGQETEEAMGFVRKTIRRLPPIGRFFVGVGIGTAFGGVMAIYRNQTNDYIKNITTRV